MTTTRRLPVLLAIAVAGSLAACGSSATPAPTTAPPPTGSPASSTSTTAAGSTATTAGGPRNLPATVADKSALTAAYVAHTKVPPGDIAGTQAGSVYYAFVPSTRTYWALATFTPSATASQRTLVGMQDGGAMGIFSRPAGGSWTMVATGSFPFCPSATPLPAEVRAVWGVSDPTGCTAQG